MTFPQKSKLFFFVEGPDDKRFFDLIICPLVKVKYNQIRTIEYSQLPKKVICKLLDVIKREGNEYIFVRDIDNYPCITRIKEKIQESYHTIDTNRIIIVVKKMEGWYLASISTELAQSFGIPKQSRTETLDKAEFERLMLGSKIYDNSRVSFLNMLLKTFSPEIAINHNTSFNYLITRIKTCSV